MPVKKFDLGLQTPVTSADENVLISQRASIELIRAVKGEIEFSTADRPQAVKEERSDERKPQNDVNESKLEGVVKNLDILNHHICFRQTDRFLANLTGSYGNQHSTIGHIYR